MSTLAHYKTSLADSIPADADPVARRWLLDLLQRGDRANSIELGGTTSAPIADVHAQAQRARARLAARGW
jgi:hypothetical protein